MWEDWSRLEWMHRPTCSWALNRWFRKGNEQTDADDFRTFLKMSIALAFVVKSIEKKKYLEWHEKCSLFAPPGRLKSYGFIPLSLRRRRTARQQSDTSRYIITQLHFLKGLRRIFLKSNHIQELHRSSFTPLNQDYNSVILNIISMSYNGHS